jgi:chemotaxis response regulator CheB
MKSQRVLLVGGSNFLRGILSRVFERSPGFSVVGELVNYQFITESIRKTGTDWVVISYPPGGKLPEPFKTLMLREFPRIRVMGISTDGSEVRIEWSGLHEKDFHGLTLEGLQEILRSDFTGHKESESR